MSFFQTTLKACKITTFFEIIALKGKQLCGSALRCCCGLLGL